MAMSKYRRFQIHRQAHLRTLKIGGMGVHEVWELVHSGRTKAAKEQGWRDLELVAALAEDWEDLEAVFGKRSTAKLKAELELPVKKVSA